MDIQQSELELWQSLEIASRFPETADLRSLCETLEQILSHQPLAIQLRVAGDVLVKLCEVCAARSQLMIATWEHHHAPSEPVVDLASCVDLFVQSLSLNVTDLFEAPEPVQYPANRQKRSSQDAEGSIVGEVDKATLLDFVEQFSTEQPLNEIELASQIKSLAHGENVEEWSRAIAQGFQGLNATVRLVELQQTLRMPMIEVWLGLLLGGYSLEQKGEFYDIQTVWITK